MQGAAVCETTSTFRDAPYAPELLFIPATDGLQKSFYIGRFAVTFDEFDYFCRQTDRPSKEDEGWGRRDPTRPSTSAGPKRKPT